MPASISLENILITTISDIGLFLGFFFCSAPVHSLRHLLRPLHLGGECISTPFTAESQRTLRLRREKTQNRATISLCYPQACTFNARAYGEVAGFLYRLALLC